MSPANTLFPYGVIFMGIFAIPKGQIKPVIFMMMRMGRYMTENKDFCECPSVIETSPGCYRVKCTTCSTVVSWVVKLKGGD